MRSTALRITATSLLAFTAASCGDRGRGSVEPAFRPTPRAESKWTYGDHQIPPASRQIDGWMDDRLVEVLHAHLEEHFGIAIPIPSGSYVDLRSPYRAGAEADPPYDHMDGLNVIFMISPTKAEAFIVHLRERCEALSTRSEERTAPDHPKYEDIGWTFQPRLDDHEISKRNISGFTTMTYTFPPGNCWIYGAFVDEASDLRMIHWVVNPKVGYVNLHATTLGPNDDWDD